MKSTSTWSQVTPEQRAQLSRWLFEENVSYAEAKERVQKEWGVACTVWSVPCAVCRVVSSSLRVDPVRLAF